jgi:2-polyprenyl-3-methyl-5-hydroxy-6-metoxy-1,4-benzoquinol methylase
MKYNNRAYWTDIHRKYKGELRAVGYPTLSEGLNQLKYRSEANAVFSGLKEIGSQFRKGGKKAISLLDVGAGSGYWSDLIHCELIEQGFEMSVTTLDISEEALEDLRKRRPQFSTVCKDLRTIDIDQFRHAFDVVVSCYCLHHLVRLDDFLNGLRFAGRSIKGGGFLMLMDPILTLPFSRFDVLVFSSFHGNGIPRHLYLIEDVLSKEGFERHGVGPAVSFLLNGNIEAYDPLSYMLMRSLWGGLSLFYRSEHFVRLFSGIFVYLDEILKRLGLGFSSSLCIYKKTSS